MSATTRNSCVALKKEKKMRTDLLSYEMETDPWNDCTLASELIDAVCMVFDVGRLVVEKGGREVVD